MTSRERRRTGLGAALFVLASGCGYHAEPPAPAKATLAPGVVAVVGSDRIDADTIGRLAAAQGVPRAAALDRAVFDALLAALARQREPAPVVRRAEQSALSRRLLESFSADARAKGAPTDEEVRVATESRWWELDCPPLRRTTHAVVLVSRPEDEKPAKVLAERIAAAVAGATDGRTFRDLATAVPASGLTVKVEDLDPVAADGRTVNPDAPPPPGSQTATFSQAFATAAFAIASVQRPGPVVRTEFGYHVLIVTELIAAHGMPLEERRRVLEPEVFLSRSARAEADALARARAAAPVDVARSALDLAAKVNVRP